MKNYIKNIKMVENLAKNHQAKFILDQTLEVQFSSRHGQCSSRCVPSVSIDFSSPPATEKSEMDFWKKRRFTKRSFL